MDIACVFESSDISEIENIKSLLEQNGIDVLVKNQSIQNLLGGLVPLLGVDPIAGAIQIFVIENEIDRALKIIEDNQDTIISINRNTVLEPETEEEDVENKETDIHKGTSKLHFLSIVCCITSFMLVPYILNIFILKKLYQKEKIRSWVVFIISTIILTSIIWVQFLFSYI
jgi:hypothetical protein